MSPTVFILESAQVLNHERDCHSSWGPFNSQRASSPQKGNSVNDFLADMFVYFLNWLVLDFHVTSRIEFL